MGILSFLILVSATSSTYVWPTKDWSTALPSQVGVNEANFEKFLSYTFGFETEGLVVIKDGLLVFEKYSPGYGPNKRHIAWSMTKMLTNALAGAAEKKGLWSLENSLSQYFPERKDSDFENLKLRHLLEWSSGFEWNETYEYNPLKSSVIAMLYGEPRSNIGQFVASRPFVARPGRRFNYSSGDSHLLMAALKKAMPEKSYENFPWKEIFDPLGIRSAVFERDGSGVFVGSSYLHISPRDLAKLGLLYLNDGVWKTQRILPEGWVFQSQKIVSSYSQGFWDRREHQLSPAAQIWVNRSSEARGIQRPLPDVPEDMFATLGHWGQSMVMIPSARIIVVRMANDRDKSFEMNKFLRLLMESLEDQFR